MDNNQTHCLDLLRAADQDRYLSVLYAPENKRGHLAALYAFNLEIARIRDHIHEPLPGEIRLQWWRDLIAGGGVSEAEGHPVAAALLQAIEQNNLPRAAFDNYCEARIFDLYDDPMPGRVELEGYCGETASAILQLASLILDADAATKAATAAGHAGVAQAICGLVRLLPLHRARGQVYVPADMLSALGVTRELLLAGTDEAANARVVTAMLALASEHLHKYRENRPAKSLAAAYLPLALTPAYIKAAQKLAGKAVAEVADIAAIRKHWLMFKANL